MIKQKENKNNHAMTIEFNVDDMNPQHIPYFMDRIIEIGASDIYVTPIIMKKGRPGFLFTITCALQLEEKVIEVVFSESTTIGIKKSMCEGVKLTRNLLKKKCSFGEIQVKEINYSDTKKRVVPEYDECRRIAEQKKIPLKEVSERLLKELNDN
ncbi:MAG: DUF111 family protein [Melioribacteraceae bacterium]|nr:DUF111 family protein [Melioribacteraceae bacterium]